MHEPQGTPEAGTSRSARRRGPRLDLTPLRGSHDLRLIFVGGGVSSAGSMLTFVAIPYQAYLLTHSSLVVGLLSLAEMVGLVLTGLVGGALADALDRRRLLRLTESGMCVAALVLVVNSSLGHPQLWVLFSVSFVFASLDGVQSPALDSLVPRLVPSDQLAATSSLMSARYELASVVATGLSGVLISLVGLRSAYVVDVATYVVSLASLWMLGKAPPPEEGSEVSFRAVVEGVRYAISRRDLLGSYLVDFDAMLFGFPNALFPQIATGLGGPAVLGFLYAAPSFGSAAVTFTSGWTARVRRRGRMIAAGAVIWGAGIVALGFSPVAWAAVVSLALAGGGDALSGLGRTTMWNESIPNAFRGRLAGVELLSYSSGPALGNVEAGLLEAFAGLRASIVSGGIVCVLGTALLSVAMPAFWRYDADRGRMLREGGEAEGPGDVRGGSGGPDEPQAWSSP